MFLCLQSFLTNREQCVKIGTFSSPFLPVISDIAQGSVIGPFLFLLFINDLTDVFDNEFVSKLYADDLKSYNCNDYRLNPDCTQQALNHISIWSDSWQLKLSNSKCGSLLLKGNINYVDNQPLLLGDDTLAKFVTVTDLGVIIDSNLSFSPHIDNVISRAKQRIYLIFKSFKSRDVWLFIFAYKTYVLPILDYCSSVWSPSKLSDIDNIENVQRYYTKRLHGLWAVPYGERLSICDLETLESRRLKFDLILCYKIVHNLIELKFNDFFEYDPNSRTRGHNLKLRIPLCKNKARKNFFAVRVIPVWNSLPGYFVNSVSLIQFKTFIVQHDISNYLNRKY